MKRCLVTGGAGFIGSYIVDSLVERGYTVRIFDNLEAQVHPGGSLPDYVNPAAEFIKGDVRDADALRKALKGIDVVFHKAAMVGVGQSQYQIQRYVDVNINGTAHLLDILANEKNTVSKLIVASSMSCYGEGQYECNDCGIVRPDLRSEDQMQDQDWELYCPICYEAVTPMVTSEEKRLECNSIYAISKKTQEEMVLNFGQTYGVPSVALRYFNVYGPRQSLSNPYTGVAAIFISRIKHDHAPVVFEDGLQTRDFVSVHDIARANVMAMEHEELAGNYNIGTGQARSIKSIAETVSSLYGKDIAPEITGTFRKGDIRHCVADISKSRESFGYSPKVTFKEGMKELMEWSATAKSADRFDEAREELKKRGLV
ncbi:nucleoside-diphosphate-sugar epimerase [candidate division KSB3 bacterium]|uniref:Nucleoside-diphosphate-sugar epimerase n=1 Tax=candidate division KSB3 bacterium TaxID=2044937 RepID=A0A2G6E4K0_9BACT|nr:MAG: nucleoside-diphosphate-sugar epimerase [candidate division KSB3 bacterium]PIE29683.1 MAG: nucleoside-diphosphate-sugar epimerase [candidate division KSB3 bacterium]